MPEILSERIARRLKDLRQRHGLSLDRLAERSGVSRATLSRLEHGDVSPTAEVLGKLCAVYALPVSRLIMMAEQSFVPLIRRGDQQSWRDGSTGFVRTLVSPPSEALAAELVRCLLPASAEITYEQPPRSGLEHHLLLESGRIDVRLEGSRYLLEPGDCLRYRLQGPTRFHNPGADPAHYLLVIL